MNNYGGMAGTTRYFCPLDCGWTYDALPCEAPAEIEAACHEHLVEHTAAVILAN